MKNIIGFSSKVSLSHKKKAIKSLEELYEENDSFQDCKIDQRTNIYVHNSFQESLRNNNIKEIKTSKTLQIEHITMEDYLQFLTIYPYYLGKYGFSLKEKQKIFIGPFLLKEKKELRVDTNINPLGMPTFAFQTGEYIRKKPEKKVVGGQGGDSGTPNVNTEETVKQNNKDLTEEGAGAGADDTVTETAVDGMTVHEASSGTGQTDRNVSSKSTSHGYTPSMSQHGRSFQSGYYGRQSYDQQSRVMQSHLRVLEDKIKTMKSSITNTNSLGDRIRELESTLKEIDFPKKKKSKELYTIFTLPSYETIKKENNLEFIQIFINGGDKVRKDIIQGLFDNEPVFNLLNKHFETAVIKPTSTLKFQYFFGFKNLNKAKTKMKETKPKEFSVKAKRLANTEIINNNDDNNNKKNNDNNKKNKISPATETPATEPPATEPPATEPDATVVAEEPESVEESPAAAIGGSKRRRKYRIKKKSKNTKKRIRFTLKEKTKKNKYLRILKKRNRKKKQQFTNRAIYKRRSLTRCTRKRV